MNRNNTKKIVCAGVMLAIGLVLPQAFHIFGPQAGTVFLPMEIPVLLTGLLLGPYYGVILGALVPILSSMITGMPALPRLYFMILQMMAYGFVAGWMIRKYKTFVSLIVGMIAGRIAFVLSVGIAVLAVGFPKEMGMTFVVSLVSGIPGILIQIIFVPVLYHVLKKGGLLLDGSVA